MDLVKSIEEAEQLDYYWSQVSLNPTKSNIAVWASYRDMVLAHALRDTLENGTQYKQLMASGNTTVIPRLQGEVVEDEPKPRVHKTSRDWPS